jgi:2-hydroxy-3-oxopropionate reductase
MNSIKKIAFIGLGRMGNPMARNLIKAGYQLTVYDVIAEKVAVLAEQGAQASTSPKDAAAEADLIISMIMSDDTLLDVTSGPNGVFHGAKAGAIFTDMSTVSPMASAQVAQEAAQRGIHYLRSKVAGSVNLAEEGTLIVFASGDRQIFDCCQDVFNVLGKVVHYVGQDEVVHYLKLVHSIIVGVYAALIGEAFMFGERGGVDWPQMIDIIQNGPLGSHFLGFNVDLLKEKTFLESGSDINTAAKDLDLALQTAHAMHIPLPMTALVRQLMSTMQANGNGDVAIFGILDVFEEMAGLGSSIEREGPKKS